MFDTNRMYEACVLVNGRSVTEVNHNGLTYIEGRSGSNYVLQFSNKSSERIMVVPSVDGLNVIDGNLCGTESPGYLIERYSSIVIPGWKVDGTTAAKFQFRPRDGSTYTEMMGQSQENQGVIGFMVFTEKAKSYATPVYNTKSPLTPYFDYTHYNYSNNYNEITSKSTVVRDVLVGSEIGTGFGEATKFNTHTVDFIKNSPFPISTLVMYYDTIQGLKKRGVPCHKFFKTYSEEPNPFPGSPSIYPGCKTPPGWTK